MKQGRWAVTEHTSAFPSNLSTTRLLVRAVVQDCSSIKRNYPPKRTRVYSTTSNRTHLSQALQYQDSHRIYCGAERKTKSTTSKEPTIPHCILLQHSLVSSLSRVRSFKSRARSVGSFLSTISVHDFCRLSNARYPSSRKTQRIAQAR